jgi:lysophospholipase L1-like esterase
VDLVTVQNSAVGGRSVRTWMNYVQGSMGTDGECLRDLDEEGVPLVQDRWQTMLDGMTEGDFLLIQFGINDGSPTCDRHVGLTAFKDSYRQMAQAATDRGAQAIFVTPVSAISCQGTSAQGTRGGYVTATQEIGTELGVPVIDLHQLSVDLYTARGFCPLPNGQSDVGADTTGEVGSFFCDDHTHFDQPGAEAIAELLAQALRDQGSQLAEHLR